MRRLSLPVAVLAALALASSAGGATLFVLKGKGWGHGVGMSQWGAQGKALRGVAYQDILRFYYQGTTLGSGGQRKVRVLLTSGRSSVKLSSGAAFTVGTKTPAANTTYSVVPAADGQVRIVGVGKFGNPATASPGGDFLRLNGSRYRGAFRLWVRSGKIAVVDVVSLQGYLYSVVPLEMPAWFELAALKAQAVAARSYAVRAARADWFDLYPDTRDQVYGGYEFELTRDPAGRARSAVRATRGQVVLYGGAVAQTFFSSSNGGVEAASVDTWGGDPGYLNARSDPDDLTPGNPNRSWRVLLKPSQVAHRLGTRAPRNAVVTRRSSGRVKSLTVSGADWSQSISGLAEYFRSALRLKSSRFWVGVQALRASRTESTCGRPVRLYVFAHDVGRVSLRQRRAGETTWTTIALTRIDKTHWRTTRHPCVSVDYRIVSRDAGGPRIHVDVSPEVAFDAVQPNDALTGKASPLLQGSAVTVERSTLSGWEFVGSGAIAADGSFRAAFDVVAGDYRAKVVPPASTGLVTGYSPRLTVVTR
jgi:stage II sporulation protein D